MHCIHTMEYYLAHQIGRTTSYSTAITCNSMDNPHHLLMEEATFKRLSIYIIPLIGNAQKRQMHRDKKQIHSWFPAEWELIVNWSQGNFGDDGNVLNFDSVCRAP